MKKVYIIHGWDGTPKEPMLQWIKKSIENKGFEVIIPYMPNASEPKIKEWVDKLKEIVETDKDVILIGHSVGCQAILRYLGTINNKIGKVILIAPWMYLDENTIKEEGEEIKEIAKPWMTTPINWKKIKENCDNFVAIFSDNDPYVPLSNINMFKKNLNAETLILKNKGHFDPSSGTEQLPEILKFIK